MVCTTFSQYRSEIKLNINYPLWNQFSCLLMPESCYLMLCPFCYPYFPMTQAQFSLHVDSLSTLLHALPFIPSLPNHCISISSPPAGYAPPPWSPPALADNPLRADTPLSVDTSLGSIGAVELSRTISVLAGLGSEAELLLPKRRIFPRFLPEGKECSLEFPFQ